MPRKNFSKKPSTSPPKAETMSPDKTTAIVDRVIVYAVFLIFKLINYLTSFLQKRNTSESNTNEDACLQIKTSEESIISISLPKNFESAIKNYGELKDEVQYLKKANTDLKKKLRNTKQDYIKCMKNLDSANAQINRAANSNPLTCKNCEGIDDEGRLKICKAIDQTYVKFEHLRLKCQYGVDDLRKISCSKSQSSHVKDIADYHIAALEHFIQWMDMKMDNIQKFDRFIKYQTNTVNVADILSHADLNDVVSTMHVGLMHFFKKYYVLLMITISDKEYIENSIYTQPKNPTEPRHEKSDETKEESTQTFTERPKYKGKAGYREDAETEQLTDNDFLEKNGRYHNLFIFLLDYLDFEPKVLIECMLKVKKNNNNSFHNLTVFDIANKVEEAYRNKRRQWNRTNLRRHKKKTRRGESGTGIDNDINGTARKYTVRTGVLNVMNTLALLMVAVLLGPAVRSFDLLEIIFGPKLAQRSDRVDRKVADANYDLSEAGYHINTFGYPFEEHEVVTEDGYILTLHRIPHNNKTFGDKRRPVALLHHGIFGASENWMFRGPTMDLCYILSDYGYDVWFSNSRGNYHSRRHKSLDPNSDAEYWKFSYHEMGYYDLPASIDYILNITSQKDLYYIGYSMGSTVGYIMLSTRPEYNKKIRFMVNFAGTGIVAHRLAPHLKVVFNSIPMVMDSLRNHNISELFPRRQLISELLGTLCQDRSPLQALCLTIIYLTVGVDYEQFNTSYVPYIFKYYPSGTSINTLLHYYQMFTRGHFAPFDPSLFDNTNQNNTRNSTPHSGYDLSKVTVPLSLHYGDGDVLVTKQDNLAIARRLKNVVGIFRVPFRHFNHLDFIWSSDSKRLLYDQVIVLMEKYR